MAESKLVVSVEEKGVQSTTSDLDKLSKSAKRAEQSTENLGKTSKSAQPAIAGVGRRAGQAGIQIQQFVGQVQGGTSAAVALSQQAADLGFVLGFPLLGAVTGIAAAFAGSLLPSLFESESASEKLEESLKDLDLVLKQTSQGTFELTKNIIELAKVSREAAELELKLGIVEATEAATLALKVFNQENELLTKGVIRSGNAARGNAERFTELAGDLGLATDELQNLVDLQRQAANDPTVENVAALREEVLRLATSSGEVTDRFVKFAKGISDASTDVIALDERAKALRETLATLGTEHEKPAAFDPKLEQELLDRRSKLRDEFRRREEQAEIDYLNRLTQLEDQRKTASVKFLQETELLGESPVEQINRLETERLATLEQFRQEDLFNQQQYEDAKTAITEEAIRQRSDLQQANTMMIVSSTADLFESLAQLEASFGDRRSSRFKTLFALSKGFAIANSLLNLNAAVVQAAADPTALTPAQKFANIAAVTAALGGVVSSIASARLPARAQGGQFAANQPFLVGENGAEIVQFNSGGRIASNSDSRDLLSGSGGMGNVTIINQTSGRVDSTDRQVNQDGDLIITIKEVLKEEVVQANSGFNKAFNQTRKSQRIL